MLKAYLRVYQQQIKSDFLLFFYLFLLSLPLVYIRLKWLLRAYQEEIQLILQVVLSSFNSLISLTIFITLLLTLC